MTRSDPGRLTPKTFPPGVDSSDFDALLAAGWCDCGRPLEGHPPLPKPKPWGGWTSQRITPPEFRSGSSAGLGGRRQLSDEEMAYRRQMGGPIIPSQRPWSLPR